MFIQRISLSFLILGISWVTAFGQWLTQDLELDAGWNSVWLYVEPAEEFLDNIFETYPQVDRVTHYPQYVSSLQFSESGQALDPQEHWLMWVRPDHPEYFVRNLELFRIHKPYLIRVEDGAPSFTIPIKGIPHPTRTRWRHDQFTLTGLPVTETSPPTFEAFFDHTDDIGTSVSEGGELYSVSAGSFGQRIIRPDRAEPEAGKAYWIKSKRQSDYVGQLMVDLDFGRFLEFSPTKEQREFTVKNDSLTEDLDVEIQLIPSEAAPAGEVENAGLIELSYRKKLSATGRNDFAPLPTTLTKTLAPKEEWPVLLTVRWDDQPAYSAISTNGAAWMGVLEIKDAAQSLIQRVGLRASQTGFSP